MNETWEQAIWLSKKIDAAGVKIDAVFAALTNIQLVVNGTGEELIGTNITVTDGTNTFQGTFSESLKLTFQLEALGTYTVTYVQNMDDEGNTVYGTVKVIISDYGYYTADVAYFPGYDLWEYWCDLGGIDASQYDSLEYVLLDTTATTILMNTDASEEYLVESGLNHDGENDSLLSTILATTDAVKALIRSSDLLYIFKTNATLRSMFVNSDTALKAAYSTSDVIKSISASGKVSADSDGGSGCSDRDYFDFTIEDENMLMIYGMVECRGSGYSYCNAESSVYINDSTNPLYSAVKNRGGELNKQNSIYVKAEDYLVVADEITSAKLYASVSAYGYCYNNASATIYYI